MSSSVTEAATRWRCDLRDYICVLEVHPDGSQLVAGSLGGDVFLVRAEDGAAFELASYDMGVLAASWSSDGSLVAIGGQDGMVRIHDRAGVERAHLALSGWANTLAWSPVDQQLAVGAGRRLVILDALGAITTDLGEQPSTVTSVAWSNDGTRVGASSYGGIAWYDAAGKRPGKAKRFDWKGSLLAMVMSPDGKWVCAGAQDSSVHLWRLWSGKDLSMSGYPAKIERLAFRADSRFLAVACVGEVTIWDFGGKGPAGTAPANAQGHERHIEDLAWRPDGTELASGCADGRITIWPSPAWPGQDLSPRRTLELDSGVGRLRWSGPSLFVGCADGGVVRIDVTDRSEQ